MKSRADLPTCHFTWIGPPSEIDKTERKEIGHDIDGVIKFAKYAENPVVFYCLEEYSDYYNNQFGKQGLKNIQVKSVQDFIQECHNLTNEPLSGQTDLITKLFDDNLKRATKRDLVTIKEFVSLLIVYLKGGYALDSNIKPMEMKSFSLPSYDDFMAPLLLGFLFPIYDVWMLYAPKNNEKAKKVFKSFLDEWQEAEEIYQRSGGDTPQWRSKVGPMINTAVQYGAMDPDVSMQFPKNYPWTYKLTEKTVIMHNLNLVKYYQGSHKTSVQKASIVMNEKEWEYKDPSAQSALSVVDIKEIFNLAINKKNLEALKYIAEKKNNLTPFLHAALNIVQDSNADAKSLFKTLLDVEKTIPLIAKDSKELHTLLEIVFIWSIPLRAHEYAQWLISKTLKEQEYDFLETVCQNNLFSIKKQLTTNKDEDTLHELIKRETVSEEKEKVEDNTQKISTMTVILFPSQKIKKRTREDEDEDEDLNVKDKNVSTNTLGQIRDK